VCHTITTLDDYLERLTIGGALCDKLPVHYTVERTKYLASDWSDLLLKYSNVGMELVDWMRYLNVGMELVDWMRYLNVGIVVESYAYSYRSPVIEQKK